MELKRRPVIALLIGRPRSIVEQSRGSIESFERGVQKAIVGLSNIGLSVAEAFTPNEVPAMPQFAERRVRLDRDEIYAK